MSFDLLQWLLLNPIVRVLTWHTHESWPFSPAQQLGNFLCFLNLFLFMLSGLRCEPTDSKCRTDERSVNLRRFYTRRERNVLSLWTEWRVEESSRWVAGTQVRGGALDESIPFLTLIIARLINFYHYIVLCFVFGVYLTERRPFVVHISCVRALITRLLSTSWSYNKNGIN